MKKNGFIALLLLVAATAAALSILLFFHRDGGPAEEDDFSPAPTPEWTAPPERTPEPAPPEEFSGPEPEPMETPEPTPAPAPTPQPTPEPTPTPHAADLSGSFSSDTGTALNLLADWSVYTDAAGNRKLEVALSAAHYSLHSAFSYQGLSLTVNGRSYGADCPAIDYDGGDRGVTPLHTFTLDAPSGSVDIQAVWHFKGGYSGQELEQITASGTADIG